MFLFLNSIVASLDGLIIGISLKLLNIKITKYNITFMVISNIFIYSIFLFLYYYFNFTFITKNITTIFYLLLAYNAYKNNDENIKYKNKLTIIQCLVLGTTHSLDGGIIALGFVYKYPLFYIISIFSFMSIFILLLGFYFANYLKNIKKGNLISSFLFILLAIINYFL